MTAVLRPLGMVVGFDLNDRVADANRVNSRKGERAVSEADLVACILTLQRHPELRAQLVVNTTVLIRENNWDVKKHEYLKLGELPDQRRFRGVPAVAGRRG